MKMRTVFCFAYFVMTATACSQVGFQSSKQETLSKSSVFGGNPADANGQIRQPGGAEGQVPVRDDQTGNDTYGQVPVTGNTGVPAYLGVPGQISQPVERMCSHRRSQDYTNFKRAQALNQSMELRVNGASCTTNKTTISNLIMKASITVAELEAICPAAVPNMGKVEPIFLFHGGSYSSEYSSDSKIAVLYASRQGTASGDELPAEMGDANCTASASPLVIHLASALGSSVELTSIASGIDFDLLGANNNHQPVRIGWFSNVDYAMLALPNAHGEVNGIDELFGDNTEGPDGQFAANGYAALAKYDGASADGHFTLAAADGRIDRNDPVHSRLRLWKDENLDGKAQPDELISLDDAGIASIDLEFSDEYEETDQYGNQTLMKSVISYDNGALDLIFDLWFRYEQY